MSQKSKMFPYPNFIRMTQPEAYLRRGEVGVSQMSGGSATGELIKPGLFWVARRGTMFRAVGGIDQTGVIIAIAVPARGVSDSRDKTGISVVENYHGAQHVPSSREI